MRKIMLVLVLVLFLVGCGEEIAEDLPEPAPLLEPEPVVESEPEPEPEPEPVKEMSAELRGILDKNNNVQSYAYLYRSPEELATYYVNGEQMKISYSSAQYFNEFMYYDVYLDGDTGYIVCNDFAECKGRKALEVDVEKYRIQTPLEVVQDIEYAEITEHTQIENKNTVIIEYVNKRGQPERAWIWEHWGMPLKRSISIGGEQYVIEYDNLVIPSTEDLDLAFWFRGDLVINYIIGILVFILVISIVFKIAKTALNILFTIMVLFLLGLIALGVFVYMDMQVVQEKLPESTNLFLVAEADELVIGFRAQGLGVGEREMLTEDEIIVLQGYYDNNEFYNMLGDNYKIFIFDAGVFDGDSDLLSLFDDPSFLSDGMKSGMIMVYPETPLFKVIKNFPMLASLRTGIGH